MASQDSCEICSYSAPSCPAVSYSVLPCSILSYSVRPCPALSCTTRPCPVLSGPIQLVTSQRSTNLPHLPRTFFTTEPLHCLLRCEVKENPALSLSMCHFQLKTKPTIHSWHQRMTGPGLNQPRYRQLRPNQLHSRANTLRLTLSRFKFQIFFLVQGRRSNVCRAVQANPNPKPEAKKGGENTGGST